MSAVIGTNGGTSSERLSASGTANALELRGVSKYFGALAAIADVTITVRPGERRAVLGSNGAGKTTLFNCITGGFLPTSGTIRLFGEDVTDFPTYERIRRGLRRTYQISLLFNELSVLDNVYLACRGVSRGRFCFRRPKISDALVSSARDLVAAVRLEAVINDPVANLSYGQQRQLEIALALADAPRFILFDEPAAGMGGVFPATEDRFGAVQRRRIPYIGSCGALDMVNFGAPDTVPERYSGRLFYEHNPQVTLMRPTADENAAVGRWIGEKLNLMEGTVRFFLPTSGVSALDAPGAAFHDPAADTALFQALESTVRQTENRQLVRSLHHINDAAFVAEVLGTFERINPTLARSMASGRIPQYRGTR